MNLRRNFIFLYDHMTNEVVKLDATIGVSLLDRNEADRIHQKLERIHPMIPHARLGEQDKAALNLQSLNQRQPTN